MENNGKSEWHKEMEESQKRFREQMDEWQRQNMKSNTEHIERMRYLDEKVRISEENLNKRFDYLAKLTGIAFEQMDEFGGQIEAAAKTLKHK